MGDKDRDDRTAPALPQDEYSRRLRELRGHPEGLEKNSRVEDEDFLGNVTTYNVKTIAYDGKATLFLERGTADGGSRHVLPPKVMEAIYRHRDGISEVRTSRGARRAAATRKAAGVKPFQRKVAGQ